MIRAAFLAVGISAAIAILFIITGIVVGLMERPTKRRK